MVRATERRRSTTKPEQSNQKMPLPRQLIFFSKVLSGSLGFSWVLQPSFCFDFVKFWGVGEWKEGGGGWGEVKWGARSLALIIHFCKPIWCTQVCTRYYNSSSNCVSRVFMRTREQTTTCSSSTHIPNHLQFAKYEIN